MKFVVLFLFICAIFAFPGSLLAALNPDINNDGKVDIVDIGIVIDNYGKNPIPNIKADLNSDQVVNIIDIGIVIDNYGKIVPASPTPSPTMQATSTPVAGADFKVAAVGDMVCGSADAGRSYPCQDGATGNTIKQINPNLVLILGDNQYESGSLADFNKFYDSLYGSFKNITRPIPGNHDYLTTGASGYYTYFGNSASPQEQGCKSNCKGYYSYDLGNWHFVALNSECYALPGGCSAGSPQEVWLKSDLAKVPAGKCILAYWHEPRFTSGHEGNNTSVTSRSLAFWQDLYSARADIVLGGHSHDYERFDLQDPNGKKDAQGIRQFVVGTGGRDFTGFWTNTLANSQAKNNNTFGVLKLTLHQNSYDWQFVPSTGTNGYKNGTFTDSGTTLCH